MVKAVVGERAERRNYNNKARGRRYWYKRFAVRRFRRFGKRWLEDAPRKYYYSGYEM